MKMERPETQDDSMKRGAAISGTVHTLLIAVALLGADFFSSDDSVPLAATDVTIIDATEFMAQLSAAPIVENDGPADLSEPADPDAAPIVPTAEAQPDRTAPVSAPPPRRPPADVVPDIAVPPPPRDVPTERVAPSIAENPVPDEMPLQAPEPESPPSTEPVIAAAPEPTQDTSPVPVPPPLPEPVPAEQPQPEPEEQPEPDPDSTAAAEIAAPAGPDPVEARLPVAKPAELAAAARAAAAAPAPEQPEPAPETTVATADPAPAAQPEATPAPAGGNRRTGRLNDREVRGLSVDVGRYMTQGRELDPSIRLIVRVRFSQDGRLIEGPELRSQSGGTPGAQNALFGHARRAIIRAANDGVFAKLPQEKFDSWERLEFVVTPQAFQAGT